ncbi:MAG: DEAD/DEAH box helicase [Nitrospinae bacterium]|nr:DEAD/DEAH box helicase [Nitrospinota bacterium]
MSEEDIVPWLLDQETFKEEYKTLLLASVSSQFSAVKVLEFEIDWNYLLKCASFLAHTDNPSAQDIALRIAQFCLQQKEQTENFQKDSAEFILNVLANRRSISLAKEQGLIEESEESWNNSFWGNVNWVRQEIDHSIWLKNGNRVDVNTFQKAFWEALNKYQNISISAPTSAGKSYLIKQWILEQISEEETLIVYVVPTRALIAEIKSDFQKALSEEIKSSKVNVTSFPLAQFSESGKPCIYVLTQERLQLLLLIESINVGVLIIDEAYKLGDSERGILLQHVIEKATLANPSIKVIYISPQASNPEILLNNDSNSFGSRFEDVTINQNLIWATQKRGKKWNLELCHPGGKENIGEITLPNTPSSPGLKLPMLAHALGQSGGNIIYVNRPSDAEKTAEQICDLIGFANQIEDQRLLDLIELCQKVIHREYKLIEALKYGVAFHYGNIPLLIREEIEGLFKEGIIAYLVCTSTLVEGVNLPCKNIFIRSPKKGVGIPMNSADFWNLAGRAGRWGKDFQGNIICVDPAIWGAPESKGLIPLRKATEDALDRQDELVEFIKNGTPRDLAANKDYKILESMASYLAISYLAYGSIENIPWMAKVEPHKIEELEEVVSKYLVADMVPDEIVTSHPGISPLAMKQMFSYFEEYQEPPEGLLVPYSTDTNAVDAYVSIFKGMFGRLTNEFGDNQGYMFRQAIATVHWMQGKPINFIIKARKKALPEESIHKTIREVLQDIESVARYKVPKYILCYNDLLKYYFQKTGRDELAEEIEDITLYLEMGVNTKTQLSLLNLGLTRTSAVEVKEYITADNFNERQCLEWFANPNNNWQSRELPKIVKREIDKMLKTHT